MTPPPLPLIASTVMRSVAKDFGLKSKLKR